MQIDHATIGSPSGMWLTIKCPSRHYQGKNIPDREAGPDAVYGTDFHTLLSNYKDSELRRLTKIEPETREWFKACNDYVGQKELDFRANHTEVKLFIEKKVALNEDIWGTLDYALVGKNKKTKKIDFELVDWKTGRNFVPAKENWQLLTYLFCLLETIKENIAGNKIGKVTLNIFHTRLQKADSWEPLIVDLPFYYKEIIEVVNICKRIENLTVDYKKFLTPGEHCRLCKCFATCESAAGYLSQSAMLGLTPITTELTKRPELPPLTQLTLDQMAVIFSKRDELIDWLTAIETHLFGLALNGEKVPGHKLVQTKPNRKFIEAPLEEMKQKMIELGIENPIRESLITLGDAEKQLKKIGKQKELLAPLLTRGTPKIILVNESDEREAFSKQDQLLEGITTLE